MSNRLKGLREKRADIVAEAKAISKKVQDEKRPDLTAEEKASQDACLAKIKGLDEDIAREVALVEAEKAAATQVEEDRTVPAFSTARTIIGAPQFITGEKAAERAHMMGKFWAAQLYGSTKAAEWCREHGIVVGKALSEGVNTAGGFLVPEQAQSEIIILRNSYGLARNRVRVWPMASDTMTIPKLVSGLTLYYVGEGVAGTTSDPVWTQVRLSAKKPMTLTYVSSELDEDSAVAMGDIITREIAYAYAKGEDDALFQGDGTSTYGGMTGLRKIFNDGVASLAGSVDAASNHDTMAEIDATDLASVQGKLPQYVYDTGSPAWYCSQTMWANVFERLIGASGGVTKDQASGRTIREYNGYPVYITASMLSPATPTTDASDVAMILFGDLNMSVAMGDRRGMTIATSVDYRFNTDQIAIRGTERFDIVCHNTGDTTNAGSIVALMGE